MSTGTRQLLHIRKLQGRVPKQFLDNSTCGINKNTLDRHFLHSGAQYIFFSGSRSCGFTLVIGVLSKQCHRYWSRLSMEEHTFVTIVSLPGTLPPVLYLLQQNFFLPLAERYAKTCEPIKQYTQEKGSKEECEFWDLVFQVMNLIQYYGTLTPHQVFSMLHIHDKEQLVEVICTMILFGTIAMGDIPTSDGNVVYLKNMS